MFWGKLFILRCLWCAHTGRMVTDRWPQSLLGHTSCQGPNPWGSPVPDGGGYWPRFVLRGQGPGEGLLWPLELQHQSWARSAQAQDTSLVQTPLLPLERGDGTWELVVSERFLGGISVQCWCPGAHVASQLQRDAEQGSTRFPM